jgi:predicted transport protein
LANAVGKVLASATKLKGSSGANEANTKVLLIEPLLAALGWDTSDLDAVEREYRVYDNTSLDYALKIDGKPRLFVEAKGIGKHLDDKQFIAQTVNYANNEGVLWCVLTNGLTYRVYKTNEPVPMEQKLLFEVDLGADEGPTTLAHDLELISRDSILEDSLESWGDRVFVDARVRKALGQLAAEPTTTFLAELGKLLGKPEITTEKLRDSLGRVLAPESLESPTPSGMPPAVHKPKPPVGSPPGAGKEYPLDHHLSGKPAAIVDNFEQLDQNGRKLGADVTRRIRKHYVGYFAGKKSFFTIEVQRQRLLVYLNLDPTKLELDQSTMRDVRNIGHFGMGDTEYSVRQAADLEGARDLIKRAYEATSS